MTRQNTSPVVMPRLQSTYGILDVMKGRKKLAKHLTKHGPVRVTIEAVIVEEHGYDDGESIEFCMDVYSVVVHDAEATARPSR